MCDISVCLCEVGPINYEYYFATASLHSVNLLFLLLTNSEDGVRENESAQPLFGVREKMIDDTSVGNQ